MNLDIESGLSELVPAAKGINRDALFFELGKQQVKPRRPATAFLAGAIAASFPWLLLTQVPTQKIVTSTPTPNPPMVLLEPAKPEPYSILAYRKIFEATNDLPLISTPGGGAQIESLSDFQKEFSLHNQ